MMPLSLSPTKVPACSATWMSLSEAMMFLSFRLTRPMTAMLGSRKIMSSGRRMAIYWVPEQFSMYQVSFWSAMNTPEAKYAP